MVFKRKVYRELLEWKNNVNGKKALLVEGARRIGKSTIVEEFAKNEYQSYILVDFNDADEAVFEAFERYLGDLDTFFMILSTTYGIELYERRSLIIFDEVQKFPKARQSVKKLVADGRYDYIETGSLISIKENVRNITIPSEERKLRMYPMDFEEFCWALDQEHMLDYIHLCFQRRESLERTLHEKAMMLFKQYMLVGGMPRSVVSFLESGRRFEEADLEKRDILSLYADDIAKADVRYKIKISGLFEHIPSFLSKHEKRIRFSSIGSTSDSSAYDDAVFWLKDSMTVNACFKCNDPSVGLSLHVDNARVKCYMGDTGLLFSHAFSKKEIVKGALYREILNDHLSMNKGMIYENAIAQILVANGHELYFYTRYNKEAKRNDIEIDFVISDGKKIDGKIYPIEVKSGKRYTTKSLNKFVQKFGARVDTAYVIHPKNLVIKDGIICIPSYMTICL